MRFLRRCSVYQAKLFAAQALESVAAARTGAIDAHRGLESLFGTVTVAAVYQNLAVVVESGGRQLRGQRSFRGRASACGAIKVKSLAACSLRLKKKGRCQVDAARMKRASRSPGARLTAWSIFFRPSLASRRLSQMAHVRAASSNLQAAAVSVDHWVLRVIPGQGSKACASLVCCGAIALQVSKVLRPGLRQSLLETGRLGCLNHRGGQEKEYGQLPA